MEVGNGLAANWESQTGNAAHHRNGSDQWYGFSQKERHTVKIETRAALLVRGQKSAKKLHSRDSKTPRQRLHNPSLTA